MVYEDTDTQKRPLLLSSRIGRPPYVLNPEDLHDCPRYTRRVIRVDKDTVLKYGRDVRLAEAEAMHLVAEKTTIACPKIIGAYVLDDITYIIMSYEEGREFSDIWETSEQTVKDRLTQQLEDYVQQMRQMKGEFIGGIDYFACQDGIFDCDASGFERVYGPFKDETDFNNGTVEALTNRHPPERRAKCVDDLSKIEWDLRRLVQSLHGHDIMFTHADLHPGKMKVRADGTVVLLDWELAGYWPDYWEFHRARFHAGKWPDFDRAMEKFIPAYYIEDFVMLHIMQKMIGG